MRLVRFSVKGFRSLAHVSDIPVSNPTILAGHNDGGKSSVLKALAYLVGDFKLDEDDRTYRPNAVGDVAAEPVLDRCEETWVEGEFFASEKECSDLCIPNLVRVRRVSREELNDQLEIWGPVPDDERLLCFTSRTVPQLKELANEFGISWSGSKKADIEAAVQMYVDSHSSGEGWTPAPKGIQARMPKLLIFNGDERPESAVRTALKVRLHVHAADPELRGQLAKLEEDVKGRLREDAEFLRDHIQKRCKDLTYVAVEPEVSFTEGLREARLKISRNFGEPISLERAGLGSTRRISLAVWEWMSQVLAPGHMGETATDAIASKDSEESPLQYIVVYDEPDTHLDYSHQRTVMRLIREQCEAENVNVIVATHSMNLIDGVDISDVVHLSLKEGRTSIERLGADEHDEIDKHLQKIAAALGLRNSVLLHERFFLAVEGGSELLAFPLLFRISEGISLQAAGIALWSGANNEGALRFAQYLREHGRSVMVAVDADSKKDNKLFREQSLRGYFGPDADEVVRFIGEPDGHNEFEELFSDELWARLANQRWSREIQWAPEDFAACRGPNHKFSGEVLTMLREGSDNGPRRKQDIMYEMAMSLKGLDEVPEQLREIFRDARNGAA
jgi:putative ATP-dependent endonuclease of OLD family